MESNNDARIVNGRMYTVRRVVDPFGRKTPFRWAGYCEGERVGFFKLKRDFWRHVEQVECCCDSACLHAVDVEMEHAVEAVRILDHLHFWSGYR